MFFNFILSYNFLLYRQCWKLYFLELSCIC